MADITSAVSAPRQSDVYAGLNTPAATGKSASTAEKAQQRFLSLLTAQLKNQDPMSPMDSAQMTSQLAQLNTVDGIERLNEAVQMLNSNAGSTASIQAASLVGKHVLIDGDRLALKAGGASGGVRLETPVDTLRVDIKDAAGNVVRSLALGPQAAGIVKFDWDGRADNGQSAGDGLYRIEATVSQGGKASKAAPLEKDTVMSVTPGKDGISLNFPSGSRLGLDSIRQFI